MKRTIEMHPATLALVLLIATVVTLQLTIATARHAMREDAAQIAALKSEIRLLESDSRVYRIMHHAGVGEWCVWWYENDRTDPND